MESKAGFFSWLRCLQFRSSHEFSGVRNSVDAWPSVKELIWVLGDLDNMVESKHGTSDR